MKSLEDLKKIRDEAARKLQMRDAKDGFRIVVGMATCGIAAGAREVLMSLVETVGLYELDNVSVVQVGCIGECALEPIVEIFDNKGNRTTYCKVHPVDADEIIREHIIKNKIIDRLLIQNYRK